MKEVIQPAALQKGVLVATHYKGQLEELKIRISLNGPGSDILVCGTKMSMEQRISVFITVLLTQCTLHSHLFQTLLS